ncbi:AraC family transcriptional regulator ligand-binding domain-containing protein [Dongia sp.]|uniref:AraC family transcriptional regulator n=1 Tax=Dongia sp. TaxID=1977262 RepID=UPI003750F886
MQLNADWAGETAAWLRERKVDLRPLLKDLGIQRRDLKFGREIDARHFAAILNFGADATGDAHFGLHRGAAFHIKHGGVLAYLAACAQTVGEALDGFERYSAVVCDGLTAQVKRDRGGAQLVFRAADSTWRQSRHLGEFGAARLIAALRVVTGVALSPLEVHFMHPQEVDPAECRRFFRCPLAYGTATHVVRFAKDDLAIRIPTADSRLGHILHAYADGLLHQVRSRQVASLEQRVEAIVADRLGSGRLSLAAVARELGLGERTLRRRLGDAGTSFSALVERKRIDLAQEWLTGTDFDLKHISFLLGYSEPAAFSRAFKRRTGSSPGRLREAGAVTSRGGRTPGRLSGRAGA